MLTRSHLQIFALFLTGLVVWGLIEGVANPHLERNKEQFILEQQQPLSHHFSETLRYKSKYMGDASNTAAVFGTLPLDGIQGFQLFPETLTAQVNLDDTMLELDQTAFGQRLLYSSAAAFAAIDNLQGIIFKFDANSYTVRREDTEQWYGSPLSQLADAKKWSGTVQTRLSDPAYVSRAAAALLKASNR